MLCFIAAGFLADFFRVLPFGHDEQKSSQRVNPWFGLKTGLTFDILNGPFGRNRRKA
jgi:hypothetical protein